MNIGDITRKLTSSNGKFSTKFTDKGLYIINTNTGKSSLVYSVKLEDINNQALHVKDGTLYLLSSRDEAMRKILPLGAAADDTCKIKHFVMLTDYGVLIGPPCGTYNTRVFV